MAIRNFRTGFGVTDTPGDVITLYAAITATSNYMTAEYPVGTDYQVPSGKTLYIGRVIWNSGSAASEIHIGYGDNGVGDGGTPPTNAVRIGGRLSGGSSNTTFVVDGLWAIPQNKYPYLRSTSNAMEVTLFCLLV